MPRNGSGVYTPISPDFPVSSGTLIEAVEFNNTINDIATALTESLSKDGQTTATGNIPMGTFKLTGLGNGSSRTDSAALGQVQDQAGTWCGTATGTANAITLTPVPAITAYVAGQKFGFIAAATNTGAVTIAVSGLATKAAQSYEAALAAGEIVIGHKYEITYDGTAFQVSAAGSSYARLQVDFKFNQVTFNLADFSASGAMAWNVDSGDVITHKYIIVGKMMTVNFHIVATSIVGPTSTTLMLKIPDGKIAAATSSNAYNFYDNAVPGVGYAAVAVGDNRITFEKTFGGGSNWQASTNNTYIVGSITFEIQ